MHFTSQKLIRLLLPVMSGAGCMIALLLAMNVIADWKNQAPRIGDLIAFEPARDALLPESVRIAVETSSGGHCVLDAYTLRRSGGSFMVSRGLAGAEARYIIHWAGARTAEGTASCGDSADLILTRRQLDRLGEAAAAGGIRQAAAAKVVSSPRGPTSRSESPG
ncbi:MAG TPA: hypothetical protein PLD10_01980 [Rhodopila sp.]|nr:hypothetical protein [Rhodopila sp.]